jgi:hypothetical protein
MNYKDQLNLTIANLTSEKDKAETELKRLEEEFANVKLNPYGITSIDFSKRQELSTDVIKMEGTLMGLALALETYEESVGATAQ